jgi:hypothetical protein
MFFADYLESNSWSNRNSFSVRTEGYAISPGDRPALFGSDSYP